MKIGFDAKRAFHNSTGLGNYSRTLVQGLSTFYPNHEYYLFNPKPSILYRPASPNLIEVQPSGFLEKKFSSVWRSSWVKRDLKRLKIDLYHGLSNEIPVGINAANIPSVVTIHDLIFERFPEQFNRIDVSIYQKKYRYACANATRIIAISEQTKRDIIDFYKIDEKRIDVCYQSCDPAFGNEIPEEQRQRVRRAFDLPEKFFLYVGSVIERKNLLNICMALVQLKGTLDIPLVVIGKGGSYLQKVKNYIAANQLADRVIFLSEKEGEGFSLRDTTTMAAVFQMALAMVYPSSFEGFGIPVLEALWSRTPVITSSTSCLPEAGGKGSLYVNPSSSNEIAEAMFKVYQDEALRQRMIQEGWEHAQLFSLEKSTASVMEVYKKITRHG